MEVWLELKREEEKDIASGKLLSALGVTQPVHTEVVLNKGLLGLGKLNDSDFLKDSEMNLIRSAVDRLLTAERAFLQSLKTNAMVNPTDLDTNYDPQLVETTVPLTKLYINIINQLDNILKLRKQELKSGGNYTIENYSEDRNILRQMIENLEKLKEYHFDHGSVLSTVDGSEWMDIHIFNVIPHKTLLNPILDLYPFAPFPSNINPIITETKTIHLGQPVWLGSNNFSEQCHFHMLPNFPFFYRTNGGCAAKNLNATEHSFIQWVSATYERPAHNGNYFYCQHIYWEEVNQQMCNSLLAGWVCNISVVLWQHKHSIWCWLTPWIMLIESWLKTIKSKLESLFETVKLKIKSLLKIIKLK